MSWYASRTRGLSEDELREHLAALVETIERENSERRMVEGKSLLGKACVLDFEFPAGSFPPSRPYVPHQAPG